MAAMLTIGLKIASAESFTVITAAVSILSVVIEVRTPVPASVYPSNVKSVAKAPMLFPAFPAIVPAIVPISSPVIPAVIPTATAPTLRLDGAQTRHTWNDHKAYCKSQRECVLLQVLNVHFPNSPEVYQNA